MHHFLNVSARQIVCFQFIAVMLLNPALCASIIAGHNNIGRHVTDTHQKQLYQRDVDSRNFGGQPQEERYIVEKQYQEDNASYNRERRLDTLC